MGSRTTGADGEDSVAELLAASRLIDPLERDDAYDEVTRNLFAATTAPRVIGRYQLSECLGRGGQGVVYAAHDPELKRRVAIKILTVQGDVAAESARLRREAQALAQLSHPNVIAINDVGVCSAGLFIVMQYVPGRTLSEWLDSKRTLREIVEAFAAAGRGLAAAHGEGVVHRDFKPSNVWMGDDGIVRLLDFGLAELERAPRTQPSQTPPISSTTPCTGEGLVAGTPPYMAPEQHEGRPATEASDQYAYCVTLFEALFGRRPFAATSVEALVTAKREATFAARPPKSGIPTGVWRLVTRGLATVPSDRWPSMAALVDALERSATPRRRLGSGTLIGFSAASATALAVWGATAIGHTRAMAACAAEAEAMDEVWSSQRSEEIAAALDATGVSYATDTWTRARARIQAFADAWKETRQSICQAGDVDGTMAESMTEASRSCLDEHRATLDALLVQFAEADAEVIRKVATASASLPLLSACTDEASLRHRAAQPTDPNERERASAVRARLTRASAASMTGRHALAFELASAALQEAQRDAQPLLVAEASLLVGIAENGLGRYEEGRQALEAAFFAASAAADDVLALRAASWLVGTVGYRLARHREGLQWQREANTLLLRLNYADDLPAAGVLANTANIYFVQGDYEQARKAAQQALDIKQEVLGPEHPELAGALNTVGSILYRQAEHEEALKLHERALVIQEEALGSMHPDVALTFNNIATVYLARFDHEKALAMFERTLTVWRASLGDDHPHVAVALSNAAIVHQYLDAPDEARKMCEEALAIQEKTMGPDHPNVASVLMNLANAHVAMDEQTRAQELYLRALAIFEKSFGPEHPEVARTLDNLGVSYHFGGAQEEALGHLQRALVIWEKVHGPDHHEVAHVLNNLGAVYRELGSHARAESLHSRASALWEKAHGPEHPEVARSVLALGDVHAFRRAFARALPYYERALAIYERADGEASQLAATRFSLARALWESGGDRTRARQLATMAKYTYGAQRFGGEKDLAEVRAWLATHR